MSMEGAAEVERPEGAATTLGFRLRGPGFRMELEHKK